MTGMVYGIHSRTQMWGSSFSSAKQVTLEATEIWVQRMRQGCSGISEGIQIQDQSGAQRERAQELDGILVSSVDFPTWSNGGS